MEEDIKFIGVSKIWKTGNGNVFTAPKRLVEIGYLSAGRNYELFVREVKTKNPPNSSSKEKALCRYSTRDLINSSYLRTTALAH